jgi:hypothetical protein
MQHAAKASQLSSHPVTGHSNKSSPLQLTSELLHCLSALPDSWPLVKVTINMDSASQWVSKMGSLFFADEYVRHDVGAQSTKQLPQLQTAAQPP